MSDNKVFRARFPAETPATRDRLHDVCCVFEKLEEDLWEHIKQLRSRRWYPPRPRASPESARGVGAGAEKQQRTGSSYQQYLENLDHFLLVCGHDASMT